LGRPRAGRRATVERMTIQRMEDVGNVRDSEGIIVGLAEQIG
jgi:hypothetical protein